MKKYTKLFLLIYEVHLDYIFTWFLLIVTSDAIGKVAFEYIGMVDAFKKIIQHEGFGALYKGLVPNS